jgi:membrane-associated phospholipid phosphatase
VNVEPNLINHDPSHLVRPGRASSWGWTRVAVSLRLEDLIALTFFLLNLAMLAFLRGEGRGEVFPGTQMGAIVIVALCLKQLLQQALGGRQYDWKRREDWRKFWSPYLETVRDWFPFLLILAMYYSLWGDVTHLLVHHDRDAMLIGWDQRLFGCQASVAAQRLITPLLTTWMALAYDSHPFIGPLVGCFVYLRRPRSNFRNLMCGLVTISFFGFLGYILVPAIGPMYTLKNEFTVPLVQFSPLLRQGTKLMEVARIQRDCFPSMHVGISFLVWLYAWKNSRRLFWVLAPVILSLWVATVYLRFHYVVDCLAGLILAPLCFWLANWMFIRFGEVRSSVRLPKMLAGGQ